MERYDDIVVAGFLAMNTWMNFAFYENATIIETLIDIVNSYRECLRGYFHWAMQAIVVLLFQEWSYDKKTMELVTINLMFMIKVLHHQIRVFWRRVDKPGTYSLHWSGLCSINGAKHTRKWRT